MTQPTSSTISVELTSEDLQLIHNALHSWLSEYGHDESDVLHHIKSVIQKLDTETAKHGAIS